MIFRILAAAVVIVHFGFVAFVVLGGMLALRWRRAMWVHLPAAAWGALIEFAGWVCPLTPLEDWLRTRGGETAYSGGFVEHYLLPVLYPAGLSRPSQWAIGVFVVGVNVTVYLLVARRHKHRLK